MLIPAGFGGSAPRRVGAVAALALLAALGACAGPGTYHGGSRYAHRHYNPPGPPGDPWGPYISEAALRFGVPEQWIRAVMRQESGGREDAVSSAGAMGLMQLIPSTYAILRARYGLGDDPFEPHDNIMAGTAYIREMYDRYGSPGFLAAYNAGPNRLDSYLANGTPLPEETVGYLSAIAPRLGGGTPLSGPLAVFAGNMGTAPAQTPYAEPSAAPPAPVVLASTSAGACDPDAAFDPDHPCAAPAFRPEPAPVEQAPRPVVTASAIYTPPPNSYAASPGYTPAPAYAQPPAYTPPPARPVLPPLVLGPEPRARPEVQLASLEAAPASGRWAIQVGAFQSRDAARDAAAAARRALPDLLSRAALDAPPTLPFGGAVLYRARLASLTPEAAARACARLSAQGSACMTVPPGR